MTPWIKDATAGMLLIVFIGAAFALALIVGHHLADAIQVAGWVK